MQVSNHVAALAASHVPAYCNTDDMHKLTPAGWAACAKAGWSESTTGAAHAGASVGSPVLAVAIITVIVLGLVFMLRGRLSGEPARS
jgi:hypothetical protein